MMVVNYQQIILRIVLLGFGLVALPVYAVTPGRILNDSDVSQADVAALSAEADAFKFIGMGIALSIAQCEGQADCVPNVDQGELQQLLQALDNHISGIIQRQQESEEDLNTILTAYVNERENYVRYLDKLGSLDQGPGDEMPAEEVFAEEEIVVEEAAAADVADQEEEDLSVFEDAEEDFSIFEDVDEDLNDL